jgi:hypothetical protein
MEPGRTAGNVTLQLPFTVKKSSYHALPSLQVLYVGELVSKRVVHHLLKAHVALSVHAARRKPLSSCPIGARLAVQIKNALPSQALYCLPIDLLYPPNSEISIF